MSYSLHPNLNCDTCLEEYMEYLRRFPFDGEHLTIQCADGTYEA